MTQQTTTRDAELRARALKVVPNGMYGHLSARTQPEGYPQFWTGGQGAFITDADGNELIDLMCSWGPMLVGHAHPLVDEAATKAARKGDVMNGPTSAFVDLSERLVAQVAHADWVMLAKNGNDATGMAVLTARAATGKRKVLVARGAYHGIAGWSSTLDAVGMTPEDHVNTIFYDYNDLASLEAAAAQGDIAAIVATPIRHDILRDLEMPTLEFAQGARALCDRIGAALILDDVRCGLRVDVRGSWEQYGVRPDLSAWSKSLANGYPLAALFGNEQMREAAGRIMVTGSFWMAGAPMAAALATLDVFEQLDGPAVLAEQGTRFQEGLRQQAAIHGLQVTVSGPPAMPFLTFGNDPDFTMSKAWASACLRNGVYLVPWHNWFLSAAHDSAVIDQVLVRTDAAFADVAT